jgi:hypothetical protein
MRRQATSAGTSSTYRVTCPTDPGLDPTELLSHPASGKGDSASNATLRETRRENGFMFEPPRMTLTDAPVVGRPAAKLLAVNEKKAGVFR